MDKIKNIFIKKVDQLLCYSSYSFLKNVESSKIINETVIDPICDAVKKGDIKSIKISIEDEDHFFFIKYMNWDTQYFEFPIYKVEHILYNHKNLKTLNTAINSFINQHCKKSNEYYFIDVPTEDTCLLQALSEAKFRIIEPRNHYYLSDVQSLTIKKNDTRLADNNDILTLKTVARKSRNIFDRVHADPAFENKLADEYLATFIEQSIKGFADFTLVPNVPNKKAFGFLSSNKPVKILDKKVSKFVLAAIDNSVEKGWFSKLVSDQIFLLKNEGADYITTTTQTTNRATIHSWEKLGFKLYSTSIIFSFKND